MFYSREHKAIVRRQRKRRRLATSTQVLPGNESMEVVSKDTTTDPTINLTKLSQFAGEYATTTIDKAVEVSSLLKEKEERISQLEQQLEIEKINKQDEIELSQ